ncbi:MAG: hypothetical protein AAF211_16410, partial [Myxococcota bacterium]
MAPGDRGAEAGIGIVEAEGDEGLVEVLTDDGVEVSALAPLGALLLLGPRLQGLSRGCPLGVGGPSLLELLHAGRLGQVDVARKEVQMPNVVRTYRLVALVVLPRLALRR